MPVPEGQSPVSCLREYCASRGLTPIYDDLGSEGGPALTWAVMVTVEDVAAIGKGPCKETATQVAAQVALNSLRTAQDSQPGDGVQRRVKVEPGEREDWGMAGEVQQLLVNKFVMILGDSNHRAVYKDLVLLLQKNDLLTTAELRAKGEMRFCNDRLLTGGIKGTLNNSVSYTEEREYATESHLVKFFFITRCYNHYVETILQQISTGRAPDLLIMNSCLWDLTRYGLSPLPEYRVRLEVLCERLGEVLTPHTLFLWTTSFPLAKQPRGGVLTPEVVMQNHRLTLEVRQANCEARTVLVKHGLNVMDMHYWLRNKLELRASDGVHWCGSAHRFISQALLSTASHLWGLSRPSFSDLRYPIMPSESLLNDPPHHRNHRLFGRMAAPYRRPVPYRVPVAHPVSRFGMGQQGWGGSHGDRTLPLCQHELEGLTRLAASVVADSGSARQPSERCRGAGLHSEGRGLSVLKSVTANVPLADRLCSEDSAFPAPPGCQFDPTPSTPTSKPPLAENVPSWPEMVLVEKGPVCGENAAGRWWTGEGVPGSDPELSGAGLAVCKPAAGDSSGASSESWSQRSLAGKRDSQTAATCDPCSPSGKIATKRDSQSAASTEPCRAAFCQRPVERSSSECVVKCEPLSPPADASELACKNGGAEPYSQAASVAVSSSQVMSASQTSSEASSVSQMTSPSTSVLQSFSKLMSVSQLSSWSKSVSQTSSQSKSTCQSSSQSKSTVCQSSSRLKSTCQSSSRSKSACQSSSQSKSTCRSSSQSKSVSQSNSCGNGQSKCQDNEGKGLGRKNKQKSRKRKSETSHSYPAKKSAVHPAGHCGWAGRTFTHTGQQGQDWSALQGSHAGHSPCRQHNSPAFDSLMGGYRHRNSLALDSLVGRYSQRNSLALDSLMGGYKHQNSLALDSLVGGYRHRNSLALDSLVDGYSRQNSLALNSLVDGYSQWNSLALDSLVGRYGQRNSLASGYSQQNSLASHSYGGNDPCWYLDSWPTIQDSFEGCSMPENLVPLDFLDTWAHYDCDQFVGAQRRQASAGRLGYGRYC